MNGLKQLPREVQVVLGGSVLYLIFSFLDWQQVSVAGFTAGLSEWHGVGIVAGLLVVALLLWEAGRLLGVKIDLGAATPGLVSVALALLLLLFTIITFLAHNEARHWPSWLGLILSLAVAAAAVVRARAEGVEIPRVQAVQPGAAPPAAEPREEAPPPGQGQPDS